jgi:alkylation response protein AidB-like acyl-CoA dehydrogenase
MTAATADLASSYETLTREVDQFMAGRPLPRYADSAESFMAELIEFQAGLHEAGLAVVSWPVRYGGRGLDPAAAAIVARRLGELGAPELANFVGIEVLAPALLRFGTEDQLDAWLPGMADASQLWCQLFSEPDAGSDLAALRTVARPCGDGWTVSGTKIWSTWGHMARWAVLLARTGTVEERHRGITAFVVDMAAPGIDARPLRAMTGRAEFAEVFLDDVRIPGSMVIGSPGQGWDVTLHILGSERGPYAVRRAAVIRAALNGVLHATRGTDLTAAARDELARAVITVRMLDLRIEAVVADLAFGRYPGPEAAVTKLMLTKAEQEVMAVAHRIESLGGLAWEGDTPAPVGDYLYSVAASIYGGSAQIQRNLIGERLLGLPR